MGHLTVLLGLSFIAGFLGTIAMTISQEIEIRFITKRSISFSPAIAFFKIFNLDFESLNKRHKIIASYVVHFVYGIVWGFPLAFLYYYGLIKPVFLSALYLTIVLVQGWVVLKILHVTDFPWTWGYKAVLTELIHKTIYTVSATCVFMLLL